MNTNAVVVVVLVVLACGLVGVSSQAQLTGTAPQRGADDGFGTDVSAFMQRSAVAANGSVDAGMWAVAFETASNLSRKQVLVHQRAATLDARLDRLETEIEAFPPTNVTSIALRTQRVRLVAERNALRSAVSEAKTNAASEGVNATGLDELSQRVENLSIPPVEANDSPTPTVDSNSATSTVDTNATATTGEPSSASRGRFDVENRRSGATYSGP